MNNNNKINNNAYQGGNNSYQGNSNHNIIQNLRNKLHHQNAQNANNDNFVNQNFNNENVNLNNQGKIDSKNKWDIPKNIPILTPDEIKNLPDDEKEKINKIKNYPKKAGRYVEVKGFKNFYRISVFDFIPFFLGSIYSLIRLFIAYGDAKRTINFNKKMMWDFKNNLWISLSFSFFFWPILIITLFIFYPYIVYDSSEVTYAWYDLIDEVTANGIKSLGTGLELYFNRAIVPLFSDSLKTSTLVVWILISTINLQTFLFYFLYRFNRKTLFEIQKNDVREQLAKFNQTKQ